MVLMSLVLHQGKEGFMSSVKTLTLSIVAAVAGLTLFSAVSASEKVSSFNGYLVDRQCADAMRQDPDPKTFIQHHTKDCALMPNCRIKGYTLFTTQKKWLNLNKRGSEIAIKLLKASKRTSGFYVEVTGTLDKELLKTDSIKEIDEPKAH